MKKVIAIMAILLLAIAPALAEQSACNAEANSDYILKDGYGNGHAVHDGIQIGYAFELPNDAGWPFFVDTNPYLGITEFKLKMSKEEQIRIAMVDHYCGLLRHYDPENKDPESIVPQVTPQPTQPVIGVSKVDPTGVSEDPFISVYETQKGHRFE